MSRNVDGDRRCERVVTEIAKNMTTFVGGGDMTNERVLRVTDSVREMDPSLWNDIEGNIQAMEEEALRRQNAPQTLPASAHISHPSVDGEDSVPSEEVENTNSLVGDNDDDDDYNDDDDDVDAPGHPNAPCYGSDIIEQAAIGEGIIASGDGATSESNVSSGNPSSIVKPIEPVVTVRLGAGTSESASGGVIIDFKKISPKNKSTQKPPEPASSSSGSSTLDAFPPASASSINTEHTRAVFPLANRNAEVDHTARNTEDDDLFDADDEVPEDQISSFTQKAKFEGNNNGNNDGNQDTTNASQVSEKGCYDILDNVSDASDAEGDEGGEEGVSGVKIPNGATVANAATIRGEDGCGEHDVVEGGVDTSDVVVKVEPRDEDEFEDALEAEAALPRIKDETVEGIMEAESLEVEFLEAFVVEIPLMKCP